MASSRRLLGATAAVALGLGAAALPADANDPTAVGWWWLGRPSAMAPAVVSPAPAPPEGGLYVAGSPNGASGISALRFKVDPDALVSTLTLTIADATGTVAIDACAPRGDWEPAENGGWDQRPQFDCEDASVTGTVDEDQTKVSFSVSRLQGGKGVIDLVLVPGRDAASQNPANFSAAFEPPADDALVVSRPNGSSSSSTVDNEVTAPAARDSVAGPPAAPDVSPPPNALVAPTEEVPATGTEAASPPAASSLGADESFAYPAVVTLPLVLLCAASYLGWALTRPITVATRVNRGQS